MAHEVAGFPYWEVVFDEVGGVALPESVTGELPAQKLTDLFIFSHGWNNDQSYARQLYETYFAHMRAVLDGRGGMPAGKKVGAVGVVWPAMRWADEPVPVGERGGAASVGGRSDADLVRDLAAVFRAPAERAAIDELARLLAARPDDPAALTRFRDLMGALAGGTDAADAPEDSGERAGLLGDTPTSVYTRLARVVPVRRGEGAAGFDAGGRLWDGAKEALRQTTYWAMKKRAGVIGQKGLGPFIGAAHTAAPGLRIHLIGHSFGGRLVSFSLAGIPAALEPSPVKSLTLLQAAFSHFAFAGSLPHDPARGGALAGMARRVDGPILVTHSLKDSAVGTAYPAASFISRDDAAAADDAMFRWGAMGHDGAQGVDAAEVRLAQSGGDYPFAPGKFLNLDANAVIVKGGPPAGAHSDIFYPELAWATLAAAGIR